MMFPVLLYHAVSDRDGSWGTVRRSQFAEHLDVIAASGRKSVTISTLAAAIHDQCGLAARSLAVSFDDGYDDTFEAVEALRNRGLRSTVYVTAGDVGRVDRLSPSQVRALAEMPDVELGAHGLTHRRLDELDDRQLSYELEGSKRWLEELSSQRIGSFAYPHGSYDRRVRAAVMGAGYRSAAAVKNAISHIDDDPYAIARFTVTADTTAERLADVLEGKGIPLSWPGERARTRIYRMSRRVRRRLRDERSPS